MIMAYEMIAYAYREGRESFEFLGSEEPYKRDWTSHVRERIQFHAFAPSPAGLAGWALHAYGRPLAKRVAALRP
jgi:CelD/BcsL family acetyltransferase involved in cellulose biosynthesis